MAVKTQSFGKASKGRGKKPPVKPVVRQNWDKDLMEKLKPTTYRELVKNPGDIYSPGKLAKLTHQAVLRWSDLTNQDHPGRVYLESVPVERPEDDDGDIVVEIYLVIESVPTPPAN